MLVIKFLRTLWLSHLFFIAGSPHPFLSQLSVSSMALFGSMPKMIQEIWIRDHYGIDFHALWNLIMKMQVSSCKYVVLSIFSIFQRYFKNAMVIHPWISYDSSMIQVLFTYFSFCFNIIILSNSNYCRYDSLRYSAFLKKILFFTIVELKGFMVENSTS